MRRKKISGVQGYGRPRRGPVGPWAVLPPPPLHEAAGVPGPRRIFENVQKNFLGKLQICIILAYFFKTKRYTFARLEEKRKCLGNVWKMLKTFDENSIEKLIIIYSLGLKLVLKIESAKKHHFSTIFFPVRRTLEPFPITPSYATVGFTSWNLLSEILTNEICNPKSFGNNSW